MLTNIKRLALVVMLVLPVLAFSVLEITDAKNGKTPTTSAATNKATRAKTGKGLFATATTNRLAKPMQAERTYTPTTQRMNVFAPLNFAEAARQEALAPAQPTVAELKSIDPPKDRPEFGPRGVAIPLDLGSSVSSQNPAPSGTGVSPAPTKTFAGEFLSGTTIPPDTMGAVGTTHVVTVSNNQMRIQDRNGVQISRMTINAFWATVSVKGVANPSTFDPKIYFDRFNNRYIFFSSANGQAYNSAVLIGISQTADPTGTWNRYEIDADPAAVSGATGGKWADYPSIGFNKNWIVAMYNFFNWGTAGGGYNSPVIYAIDKANAYTNPVSLTTSVFTADFNAVCLPSATPQTELACGFTMAPAITEDNTTNTEYLVEDWDSQAAQLRLAKITGTGPAPVLTVGTQFPQSVNSWRFDARRIASSGAATAGASGGYMPQHQQSAHLVSGTRLMANDSRIQNAVLRNGALWCAHTVMLSTVPQLAGTAIGASPAPVPDNHSGIQWWQIDPTLTDAGTGTLPTQRGRLEDPLADNCHDGAGLNRATAPCNNSTLNQVGEFFAFPNISVNKDNNVLIGFTQFSALSYASAAYAYRASADAPNTLRDLVVYHAGESNMNLGSGSGTARQNRWGDTSAAQTDPLNDTDFWTVQEYPGIYRDFGIGVACPWETWWAQISPSNAAPATTGTLLINEFRLRGPQGVRDEFVELYNPSNTPLKVTTTDNSDGWAVVYSSNGSTATGVAVVPNGTFIPARGHILIANDPDSTGATGLPTVVYSLSAYPNTAVRTSESDIGWAFDLADNGGFAVFKSSTTTAWTAPNLTDSAGFAGIAVGLFKEGTGIPNISATTPTGQMTFVRKQASGLPQDTGDNASDFIFADPVAETLTVAPKLGAAGPENVDSAIHNTTSSMGLPVFDNTATAGSAPNFVYDPTPITNGTAGSITVRRKLVNSTGNSISRVRFRVVDITTRDAAGSPPAGTADLRLLTSTNLTLEEPPTQALGGGFNASANPTAITLTTPLANGANTPVDFKFGVNQVGCFHFVIVGEALPGGANTTFGFAGSAGGAGCVPTAAPANISGTVATADGTPLAGVTMNLSGARTARAITDSNGNYTFTNNNTDSFYTVTPSLTNYHFGPENRSFSLVANKSDAVFTASPDAVIVGNAIDSADYFVRQHYLDFLGREPDEAGLNFWSDQLLACGADAACVENKRINVSAAYFLSIEFQQTGGLVDSLYRASFGRRANYAEFMPDQKSIAQNIRVGVGSWQQDLVTNKQAFVDGWMQRPAFRAAYNGLSNSAYVDALISHAGKGFNGDRNALVSALDSSTSSRASVLMQVVENEGFVNAKRNEAFVMMQYFGYLRRDPDASGFAFWLTKLNQFDGNFEQAEMVKAFLVSAEYRNRFGR